MRVLRRGRRWADLASGLGAGLALGGRERRVGFIGRVVRFFGFLLLVSFVSFRFPSFLAEHSYFFPLTYLTSPSLSFPLLSDRLIVSLCP